MHTDLLMISACGTGRQTLLRHGSVNTWGSSEGTNESSSDLTWCHTASHRKIEDHLRYHLLSALRCPVRDWQMNTQPPDDDDDDDDDDELLSCRSTHPV